MSKPFTREQIEALQGTETQRAKADEYARRIILRYEALIAADKEDDANALFDLSAPEES